MPENIRDYGGVENDDSLSAISQNIAAINDASVAASDNTVYLPSGIWYIGAPPDQWGGFGLWCGNPNHERGAAGLGFVGDGPGESILRWGYVKDGYPNSIRYYDQVTHDNVEWRDMTYDGNVQNLDFGTDDTFLIAADFTTDFGLSMENVHVRNFPYKGFRLSSGTATIDRCTFENMGIHRLNRELADPDVDFAQSSQPIPVTGSVDLTVTNSKFKDIALVCIDYSNGSTGNLTVDNVYASGTGVGFLKINDATSATVRRLRHIASTQSLLDKSNHPDLTGDTLFYRQDGNDSSAVPLALEDVYGSSYSNAAMRVADGYGISLTGTAGRPIAIENTSIEDDSYDGTIEHLDGQIDFDVPELSVHNVNGSKIFQLRDSTGTIDTLRRGSDDTLGENGGMSIGTDDVGATPYAPEVPGSNEVGAGSTSSSDDTAPNVSWVSPNSGATVEGGVTLQIGGSDQEDSDESLTVEYRVDSGTWVGATYNTDTGYFEDSWDTTSLSDGSHSIEARVTDSTGSTASTSIDVSTSNSGSGSLFDEWTSRWDGTQADWGVASDSSFTGGHGLVFDPDDTSAKQYAISWDSAGEPSDVEVLDRFKVPNILDGQGFASQARVFLRAGTSSNGIDGYCIGINHNHNLEQATAFRVGKYADGNFRGLRRFGSPQEGTLYYRRFRANGSDLKVKIWPAEQDEPSGWDVSLSDSDHSSGWVGTGSFHPARAETDVFSVATGGETAQFVGSDSAPSSSWVTPADGETVSGTVTAQIDATDAEDSTGSLSVSSRVDGGAWTTATYNADTGYYEVSWDTTAVADGDHTLEARAVDSAGNTDSTTITVTTDNTAPSSAPTVDSLSLAEVETSTSDAEFDAGWQVSDADSDLTTLEVELTDAADGSLEDSTTLDISGETASGTTRLVAADDDGSGHGYDVTVVVTDGAGNTATGTETTSETEETASGPMVNQFSVSEANRPDPHAEITVVWDVSAPDEGLASVDIDVSNSGETLKNVVWSLSGPSASDVDSFTIKDSEGQTFDVTLTVTDAAGNATSEQKSAAE